VNIATKTEENLFFTTHRNMTEEYSTLSNALIARLRMRLTAMLSDSTLKRKD
jgi:hypothetical protein